MIPVPQETTRAQIGRMLAPATIAIVGASADLEQFNGRVVKNLLRHGYAGKVYPVNPKYKEVAGRPCYPALGDLPERPETVFIAVGPRRVAGIMREAAALGIPVATIYSAGFSEAGPEGARLEEEIAGIARAAGMRVCGPNTAGYHNFHARVQLAGIIALEIDRVIPGRVGVVCQSGSIGGALISRATHRGIGFSHLISCGNEMDLEAADYVDFLLEDPETRAVALYLEGLKDPPKFLRAAEKALALGKPLVVCKVGRSDAGRAAAVSHTGALVGEDRAYDAAFRQWGITRTEGLEELLETAHMFAASPLPCGRRVGILSTSGGAGALIADGCGALGLEIPPIGEGMAARIRQTLPDFVAVNNPIDTTIAGISSFRAILEVILDERPFDILAAVVGSSAQFRPAIAIDPLLRAQADGRLGGVPVLAYFNPYAEEAHRRMAEAGLPSFHTTEGLIRAAGHLAAHARFRERWRPAKPPASPREIPEAARANLTPGTLSEAASLDVADAFGLCSVPRHLCRDWSEAAASARALGYPVVLKVSSPEVPHKTEHGFVAAGLADEAALQRAFDEIARKLDETKPRRIDGFLVQKMIRGGEEFFLGAFRDRQFGLLITVGLGGAAAEAMGDVTVRLAPVSRVEAEAMLDELRAASLLGPFRGRGPLDRGALAKAIICFGDMALALGDDFCEADLNPVFVLPEGEGAVAADALIVMGGRESAL